MADFLDTLAAQAQAAIDQGADPAWVKQTFAKEVYRYGYDPDKVVFNYDPNAVDPDTKKAYKSAVRGGQDEAIDVADNTVTMQPGLLATINKKQMVKNSPLHPDFGNVSANSDTTAPQDWGDATTYTAEGLIKKGLGGLSGPAAAAYGLLNPLAPPEATDEIFQQGQALREAGEQDLKKGNNGIVGNIIGGAFPTTFLGDIFNAGAEKLDEGKNLGEAEKATGLAGAEAEAYTAAGLLGKQGAGVLPYLTRSGSQAGANVGITAADRYLNDEELSKTDIGMAIGQGAFGGLFREEKGGKAPKAKDKIDIPETGDPSFDSAVEAVKNDNYDFEAAFKRQNEARRAQSEPAQGDLFADVPAEQSDLFGPNKDAGDVEAARAAQAEAPEQRSLADQQALEQGYLYDKTVQNPGIFEPSRNEQVEQPQPEQGHLPWQEDMLNAKGPTDPYAGLSPYKARQARIAEAQASKAVPEAPREETPDLSDAIRQAEASMGNLDKEGVGEALKGDYYKAGGIPQEWKEATRDGTLTFGRVLDDVANGETNAPPVARAFAKYIGAIGKKFGGLDSTYHEFNDNDPYHASYMAKKALEGKEAPGAYYSTSENKTRVNPQSQSLHDYLHEGVHSVVARAVEAGRLGKLTGEGALAFNRLNRIYQEVAKVPREGLHPHIGYGFKNIHEFTAELFSNPKFQEHLKSIPFKDVEDRIEPTSPVKASFARVRNLYDATVKVIGKLLGLNPKLENMLDASISASHEFFAKTSRSEADKIIPQKPLENQVPNKLERQRGPKEQAILEAIRPKGSEPRVTMALKTKEGETSYGHIDAIQTRNRIKAVTTPENREALREALTGNAAAFEKLDDKAKAVVKAELKNDAQRMIELAKEAALNKNLSPKAKRDIADALKDTSKTQTNLTEAGAIPGAMDSKYKLVQKAEAKATAGKPLSPREERAVKSVQTARKYLEEKWFPQAISEMTNKELEPLYRYHTNGLDPDKLPFEGAAKTDAMKLAIADGIRNTVNKDGAIENILKASMDIGDKTNPMRRYYKAMRDNMFDQLPPELHQLWNPIMEPAARAAANVLRQRTKIANMRALNQLKEQGMGTLFTDQKGTKTHTEPLQGERFGPLQGLLTTPNVKRAIEAAFDHIYLNNRLLDHMLTDNTGKGAVGAIASKLADVWKRGGSWIKAASVIGRVGNYLTNFAGSGLQVLSNGNSNGQAMRKGMMNAIEALGVTAKKNMSEDLKDMFKYRIMEYSWIQEIRGSEKADILSSILKQAAEDKDPKSTLQSIAQKYLTNPTRQTTQLVKEIYGIMDWWTKAANWHNELDFWKDYAKRNNTGETLEQIKQKVAERINDTNITPSMAPKVIRGAESFAASFLTYYAEIPRTLGMNMKYGGEDLFRGWNRKDFKLMQHGLDRLMGTAVATAGTTFLAESIAKGVAGAAGLVASQLGDDDPRKKYIDNDPFLAAQVPMMLTDPAHPEAGEYMYDASRADPYAPTMAPFRKMVEGIAKYEQGDKDGAKKDLDMGYKMFVGLFDSNRVWATIRRTMAGAKPKLATDDPKAYDQKHGELTDMGLSSKQADGLMLLMEQVLPRTSKDVRAAKNVSSPTLAAAVGAGVGVQKLDVAKDVSNYVGGVDKDKIQQARTGYLDLMKQNYENKPGRVEDDFKKALKDASEPYEHLRDAVNAAKAQGASRSEMLKRLKAADISKEVAYAILHNKPLTPAMIDGDLKKDYQRDLIDAIGDPEAKAQARQRYRDNNRLMRQLVRKYKNVSIEDID